jgi:hypothetical protein
MYLAKLSLSSLVSLSKPGASFAGSDQSTVSNSALSSAYSASRSAGSGVPVPPFQYSGFAALKAPLAAYCVGDSTGFGATTAVIDSAAATHPSRSRPIVVCVRSSANRLSPAACLTFTGGTTYEVISSSRCKCPAIII